MTSKSINHIGFSFVKFNFSVHWLSCKNTLQSGMNQLSQKEVCSFLNDKSPTFFVNSYERLR